MINTKTQAETSRKDNIAAKSYAKIVESKYFSSNNDLPGMFPRRVIDGNNIEKFNAVDPYLKNFSDVKLIFDPVSEDNTDQEDFLPFIEYKK